MPTAPRYHRDLLESCLQLRPASDLDRIAHDAETSYPADPDPETWYYEGALFAYCGKKPGSAASSGKCHRKQLLLVLKPFVGSPAGETSCRSRYRQIADRCPTMPGRCPRN